MKLFAIAGNLDVATWIRGLLSAGISGGASAITGGVTTSMLAPETFNLQTGKFYVLVFGLFAMNAIVSIAKFLQSHPVPDVITERSTAVISHPGAADTTVTTVKETSTTSGIL